MAAAILKKPSLLQNLFLQSNTEYLAEQMEEMRQVATDLVYAVYFEIRAYTTLPEETRAKYLALLGYSWNGKQIVEF